MSIEKRLEHKLVIEVRKRGGYALKLMCFTFTGMPDRLVLMPGGQALFAEVKDAGKKANPKQTLRINWLQKLGFAAKTINSEESLQEFLKLLEK